MSLENLNKELHSRVDEEKPKEPVASPAALPTLPELERVEKVPDVPLGDAWGGQEKREEAIGPDTPVQPKLFRIPKKMALVLGLVGLASLAAGVFFKAGGWLFAPENVQVTVNGPKETESNKIVEYTISFENNNWVDLENAELIITYPTIFRFIPGNGFEANTSRATLQLGTIKKSSLSSIKIKGSFQSLQDQVALITATLRAAPSGVTSQVDFETRYSVAVEGSSLIMDLAAPLQAGDGQFADYVVTYRNESNIVMENLELRLGYPEGFTFQESTPRASRNDNVWSISSIAPGDSGTVTIHGTLTGSQGDVKRVTAELGTVQGDGTLFSYADIIRQTRIIASPLVISQKVNDGENRSAEPGENLSYRLLFRNDGDVGLRDLIVTVDLDPKYFDISRLQLNGGTYNVQKKQVIFRASDRDVLSLIEPGQSGEINFSVPVRADIARYKENSIEIESVAKIDSPDVPTPIGANKIIASNRISFKIRTAALFAFRGYHFDAFGNTGPIPPVVGQETFYTLDIRAASTINSMESSVVELVLPGQVRYVKTYAVSQGTVTYNDRTGELFWNIGTIAPGAEQSVALTIQIGLTPDPSQVDNESRLTNSIAFSGKDLWTGDSIQATAPVKTTSLVEDSQLQALRGGKVVAN